jgi:hypothetical protein
MVMVMVIATDQKLKLTPKMGIYDQKPRLDYFPGFFCTHLGD